jgi:hypothetical protein
MFVIIPGTILYRCQIEEDSEIIFRKCCDTGKMGCYLTPSRHIAEGIAKEKKNLSNRFFIHTYRVVKEFSLPLGKYSFRNIHPERYFDKSGKMFLNVEPQKDENISHYDFIYAIDSDNDDEGMEIFIIKDEEKDSIEYIESEIIDLI